MKKQPKSKPPKAPKIGRPPKEIDERQVLTLAKIGCTASEIAAVMGCHVNTIQNRFCGVINEGHEHMKSSLRRWQYTAASNGNVTMQIWLGKQWLGQKDKQELTGEDGGAMKVEVVYLNKKANGDSN